MAVALIVLVAQHIKLNEKYGVILDTLETANVNLPPINNDQYQKMISYYNQYVKMTEILFRFLLEFIDETDDDKLMDKVFSVRDDAVTMYKSKSLYVRNAYHKVIIEHKYEIEPLMYYLCALLDVRKVSDILSAGFAMTYNTCKNQIITSQMKIMEIDTKGVLSDEESENEENIIEDYDEKDYPEDDDEWDEEDDYETPEGFIEGVKNLFKPYR